MKNKPLSAVVALVALVVGAFVVANWLSSVNFAPPKSSAPAPPPLGQYGVPSFTAGTASGVSTADGLSLKTTSIKASGYKLVVGVDFTGKSKANVNSLLESCLRIDGGDKYNQYELYAIGQSISEQSQYHLTGALTFPLVLNGTYRLAFGCSRDAGWQIPLGSNRIGLVGVSRGSHISSEDIVILYTDRTDQALTIDVAYTGTEPDILKRTCVETKHGLVNPLSIKQTSIEQGKNLPIYNGVDPHLGQLWIGKLIFPADTYGTLYGKCSGYSNKKVNTIFTPVRIS